MMCAMRDFLLITLSFNAFHVTLNVMAEDEDTVSSISQCPFVKWYSSILLLCLLTCSITSLAAYARGWSNCSRVTWAVDCVGVLPGIFWIVTTKPYGWFAAANVPGCSIAETPLALVFWLIGEWLTWGTITRLVISTQFGVDMLNTLIVILGAGLLSALNFIMAMFLREAYDLQS